MKKKKTLWILVALVLLLVLGYQGFHQSQRVKIMTGYAAKVSCSCLFVSNLSEELIKRDELGFSPVSITSTEIDYEQKAVTATVFGLFPRTAQYIKGLGCQLKTRSATKPEQYKIPDVSSANPMISWFDVYNQDSSSLTKSQISALNELTQEAFDENLTDEKLKKTKAVVIVHRGQLITEAYADGINKNTRLLGWSMTKSVIATMVGTMAREGKINLHATADYSPWNMDDRQGITYFNLLNMNSGLRWEEDYGKISSVTKMLFRKSNMGDFAASQPLAHEPGSFWYYSSGTTNALSLILSKKFDNVSAYRDYIYRKCFAIGLGSFMIETDVAGYPVGSSYGWASARDWAKFGQIYLDNGVLPNGDTLFDREWIDFVKKPVTGSEGEYGGHFWVNQQGKRYPSSPRNMFFCDGYQGQRVFILPSQQLVVVRLGNMYRVDDEYLDQWLSKIVDVIDE